MLNKHEIRNHERKPLSLEAVLAYSSIKYQAFIQNVSEKGLNIVSYPSGSVRSFTPRERLGLKFQPSGKEINLECEVSWVHITKNLSHGLIYTIAMEIKQQVTEYMEFLKTL